MNWEPVIGLEVHAELKTASKMFCSCPTVDVILAEPNTAVCPVCLGMPGVLPVVNKKAVELAIRAALALDCTVQPLSIFARKNYFYPDLPKGYQISQYEEPLAVNGKLKIVTSQGEKIIRVRRAHLEEDTGKLTHVTKGKESYSLVDLNRAGVPLLEIVSEPDMQTVEEAKAYAEALHLLLRYVDASTCDMEKGVIRFEANVSIRPQGSDELNTRTEIKNLNSFRALERAVAYEIQRQIQVVESGGRVIQETVGWNEAEGITFSQRSKEEAHDYRYFPEPDLPPLVIEADWLDGIRRTLPELPEAKTMRYRNEFGLGEYDTRLLVENISLGEYFEKVLKHGKQISPKTAANWILGEVLSKTNQNNSSIDHIPVPARNLAELIDLVEAKTINLTTAKSVFAEMFTTGRSASEIVKEKGLTQISDQNLIFELIDQVINENPKEVAAFKAGKTTLSNWFFGQVMAKAKGQAEPGLVRSELEKRLNSL